MPDENSQSCPQVIEKNLAERVRREVDSVVAVVENRFHDAILTPMDSVVIATVEKTVSSLTGSSGHRPKNAGQNFGRRNVSGKEEFTPLKTASSCKD